MPGVQDIVSRVRSQGAVSPEQLVESCLDLIGPVEVTERTRQEMVAHAQQAGEVRWDTEGASSTSTRRVAEMLQLIASSREYQFG